MLGDQVSEDTCRALEVVLQGALRPREATHNATGRAASTATEVWATAGPRQPFPGGQRRPSLAGIAPGLAVP